MINPVVLQKKRLNNISQNKVDGKRPFSGNFAWANATEGL